MRSWGRRGAFRSINNNWEENYKYNGSKFKHGGLIFIFDVFILQHPRYQNTCQNFLEILVSQTMPDSHWMSHWGHCPELETSSSYCPFCFWLFSSLFQDFPQHLNLKLGVKDIFMTRNLVILGLGWTSLKGRSVSSSPPMPLRMSLILTL